MIWIVLGGGVISWYVLREDWLDRLYPSPSEWTWLTRMAWRDAQHEEATDGHGRGEIDWGMVGAKYRVVVGFCEDPSLFSQSKNALKTHDDWDRTLPGLDLEDIERQPKSTVWAHSKIGFDCSDKPEPWRRGYFTAMMGVAKAAEYTDDYVIDMKRNIGFPSNQVVGPSNPYPWPVFPGSPEAPLEENCQRAFEKADMFYIRILTTKGFSPRQRMDAGLAYAQWLDFCGNPSLASQYYHWSLDIAYAGLSNPETILNTQTGVIRASAPFVTPNILASTTALASHNARNANISAAISIYASILRARRSAAEAPKNQQYKPLGQDLSLKSVDSVLRWITSLPFAPTMPEEPPSGNEPFVRTQAANCEEAAIMMYLGEIMFATSAQREGLSWTRDAVALAEKGHGDWRLDKQAKKVCTQCLETGFGNWHRMVGTLARKAEEGHGVTPTEAKGWRAWMPFRGAGKADVLQEADWTQEEKMVAKRQADFWEEQLNKRLQAAVSGTSSWFVV